MEQALRWDWLKKNPVGAQGIYFLDSKGLDGVLTVEAGDEGMYAVVITVTMKAEPHNSGELDGFGILEGKSMEAEDKNDEGAKVSIMFDGDKAIITSSDAFKTSGFAGAGVVFDGTYLRQKAAASK